MFSASTLPLLGMEPNPVRTNWFDRCLTNAIEIRMPLNRFVNEYHTNWFTQLRTNAIEVFATNRITCTLTNSVVVQATRTNLVTAYQTNWSTKTFTNTLSVTLLRTNFVDQYHTNWSTLNLTNWETVLLFKTNRITQPVTNLVQIDLPTPPAAAVAAPTEVVEPREARVEVTSPAPVPGWSGPLAIEAARTARPPANNLVEVQLKIRRTDNSSAPLQVQYWRVEREDGAVLCFAQDPEFKRQLPIGKYKVEARLKPEGDNPPLSARGTLSVTTRDAVIQQRLLVKK